MGWFTKRAIEMCCRNEPAQIVISNRILRIERKPVICWRNRVGAVRPRKAQHRCDNWLHPSRSASIRKRHRAVKPVAINNCRRRKTQFLRAFGDILRVKRTLKHRIG